MKTNPRVECNQREEQAVRLLLEGCENQEIARELGVSVRTVKAYMNRMFRRYEITGGIRRVKLAVLMYGRERCSPIIAGSHSAKTLEPEASRIYRP